MNTQADIAGDEPQLPRLSASEQHLRLFVEHAPVAIAMFDREMRYLETSARWRADFNLEGTLAGRSHYEVFPEISESWKAVHKRCLNGAVERSAGEPFERADGSVQWVKWEVCPWRDARGDIGGVVIASEDITSRNDSEAAAAYLAAIVMASSDAILSKSLNGVITSWNDGATRLFGYSADEMMKQPITRIIPPDRIEEENSILARLRMGERIDNYETVRVAKDGRRLDVSLTMSPVKDRSGKVIGASTIIHDITDEKRAAVSLRENQLRTLLATEAAGIGIWEWNIVTGAVRWDAQTFRIYGITPTADGFVNYNTWAACVLPEDLAEQKELIRKHGREGGINRHEFRIRRKDNGEIRNIQGADTFRQNAQGQDEWVVGTNLDVTDLKRAEQALREADKRKDEFLATLAHELRNPLAPIRTGLHVLRKTGGAGVDSARLHDMMERQVDHLVRLVDDLLDVSRISCGKIELKMERVNLAKVIDHAIETVRQAIEARDLKLSVIAPEPPLFLDADPVRLAQVFANLLNNAAKYTDAGGRIEISADRRGSEAVVSVTDTGVGIPAEMLGRVFDLFTQVNSTLGRSHGGLGIGLALVREIIRLHGGEVEAHSDGQGRGSRFVVRLPLPTTPTGETTVLKATREAPPLRRVLVIDDNRDVADSFVQLLKCLGATVRIAYDGASGIQEFIDFKPDLVFLDLGMPGMDGYETAQRIRELPEGKKVSLAALTGWGNERSRSRTEEGGFDHHLVKPARAEDIERILATSGDRKSEAPQLCSGE
jgi:PAS domain S-box-containing protein